MPSVEAAEKDVQARQADISQPTEPTIDDVIEIRQTNGQDAASPAALTRRRSQEGSLELEGAINLAIRSPSASSPHASHINSNQHRITSEGARDSVNASDADMGGDQEAQEDDPSPFSRPPPGYNLAGESLYASKTVSLAY